MAATSREHVNIFDYYSPVAEIDEFINLWYGDQVKKDSTRAYFCLTQTTVIE